MLWRRPWQIPQLVDGFVTEGVLCVRPQLSVLGLVRYLRPGVQGYAFHASAAPGRDTTLPLVH